MLLQVVATGPYRDIDSGQVETLHLGRRGGKVQARASVRDTLVAEAEMKFMLVDSPSNVEDQEL